MIPKRYILLALVLAWAIYPVLLAAQQTFTAKVIGISDGDTIKVLKGQTQIKVRLHGIDSPEKGQAFGNKAKQFTSEMVFGKTRNVNRKLTPNDNAILTPFMVR